MYQYFSDYSEYRKSHEREEWVSGMHFHGKEIISQVTQKSGRNLVATSSAIMLALYYRVPLADLKILGVDIPSRAITGGTVIVLLFLVVNHLVHWTGDFRSMQAWNSKESANGEPMWDYGSPIVSKLDSALIPLKQLSGYFSEKDEEWRTNNGRELEASLEEASRRIEEIKVSAICFRRHAALYVYVWYLALPVGLGIAAIIWAGGWSPTSSAAHNFAPSETAWTVTATCATPCPQCRRCTTAESKTTRFQ